MFLFFIFHYLLEPQLLGLLAYNIYNSNIKVYIITKYNIMQFYNSNVEVYTTWKRKEKLDRII
jgi:hypothetical protein